MLGWRSLLVEQGCREGGAPQPHLTRLMQGWSSPSSPCKPQLSPVVIRRQTFDPYTWKHDLEGWNWHNLHQDWPFHPQCTWQWFFFFSWLRNWHRSLATRHILQLLSTHTLGFPSESLQDSHLLWTTYEFMLTYKVLLQHIPGYGTRKSSEWFSWIKVSLTSPTA